MTLLEQCQVWHIHDQHQKIFDAIEALSPEQRTADTDMELARACNNLADPETRDGRALLRRAIGLLEAHQAELQDTYSWNFRMGYAYYYLDQEGPALRYFIRALDLHPGDGPDVNTAEEVQSLISDCRERLALPWFQQQFRERAAAAWAAFRQGEAGLLNLLGQGQTQQAAALCQQLLAPVVEEICPALQICDGRRQLCCSAAGSLLCVAGIYLGIRDVRLARRRQRLTPYKRFWYKWHHILGTVFGLFVLTFCFSGMMSLVDVEDLGIRSRLDFSPIQRLENMRPTEYTLDYREVIKNSPRKIRQMTWEHIGPIPFYHLRTDKGQVRIDARYNDPTRALNLTPVDLRPILAAVHGDTATIRLTQLTAYDHYYLARSGHLSLPVWLATVDDANHSRYYINPSTGRCRYFGRTERWQHWLYPALHSLRLQPLIAHPWAWNLVMWGLMLGGTLVSFTGLRLAINYLRRKFKR